MELDKYIESALSGVLKNPVSALLREIGMARLLRQSNFTKCSVGFAPYLIMLHFVYMLVMHKRQSAFVRQSGDAFDNGDAFPVNDACWPISARIL